MDDKKDECDEGNDSMCRDIGEDCCAPNDEERKCVEGYSVKDIPFELTSYARRGEDDWCSGWGADPWYTCIPDHCWDKHGGSVEEKLKEIEM